MLHLKIETLNRKINSIEIKNQAQSEIFFDLLKILRR